MGQLLVLVLVILIMVQTNGTSSIWNCAGSREAYQVMLWLLLKSFSQHCLRFIGHMIHIQGDMKCKPTVWPEGDG